MLLNERGLVHHSKFGCRCPHWVIFERSSRFCLPVHVRFAPESGLEAGPERVPERIESPLYRSSGRDVRQCCSTAA